MPETLPKTWSRDPILRDYVHGEIRRYLSRGMSDKEVADRLGIAPRSVWRYRHERNIPAFIEAA